MVRLVRRGSVAACLMLSGMIATAWAETPPESPLERGRALVNGIVACGNCHTPQGPNGPVAGQELAGGTPFVEEPFTAYASNITPDPETGIGRWTDEQLIAAIREGKRPDGSLIGPPMPFGFYRGLSDGDLRAIVAYLRSVPPVRHSVPKSEYRMALPAAYGPPVGTVAEVPRTDPVTYGAYMAGPLGHCMECHTPMLPDGRLDRTRMGAGGRNFTGPWGNAVSRNITQDKEHGLGGWTDAEIRKAITEGVRPDGHRLSPPMGYHYYKSMSDGELSALVAYLRTLPPTR
ncbi:cbb3-type cytochrome c oxidase subunit III [Azospirillum brasilense]|uniref:Cbb3-type cytochrome c oxidase subunit III n=1 Tax=Azospirillum brasilense TaxID=192 RepID=A0A560BF66_AZOBR|nr:c-type cytochrome [Azospirillum brasilense]TWA71274.1 cbb3-type cytochrome c oxidase subunit III [Azospirillum brasilense]